MPVPASPTNATRSRVTTRRRLASAVAAVTVAPLAGPLLSAAPASASTTLDWTPALSLASTAVTNPTDLARAADPAKSWLYSLNGTGGGTKVYALTSAGATKSTVTLKGAKNTDWEDLASGAGKVWVADSGDSGLTRGGAFTVYSFNEPTTWKSALTVTPTTYSFKTPDGAKDLRAMMVDPAGRLYLVSKAATGAAIYAAPTTLSTSSTNALTWVADAPADIVSASWSPDGSKIVLGSASRLFVYGALGSEPQVFNQPGGASTGLDFTANGSRLLSAAGSSVSTASAALGSPLSTAQSLSLTPGTPITATDDPTTFLDGSGAVSFTIPTVTRVGSGLSFGTLLRSTDGTNGYRAQVGVDPSGSEVATVVRVTGGVETTLGAYALPATAAAGDSVRVEADVQGSGASVTVRMRAWEHGRTAPAWQVTTADASVDRVTTAGRSYPWAALSGSASGTLALPYGAVTVTRTNLSPTAVASATASDLTASFDGSASSDPDGAVASYSWSFSDGGTATGATAGRTFAAAGSYDATLTVTDSDGATSSTTTTVTVTAPPPVVVTPTPTPAPTSPVMLGMFRGNSSEDPDTSYKSLYGEYPALTSSYYTTGAPNTKYETARVQRGTDVFMDFDTKSTPGQIGLIADRDASTMTNWVDRNLATAEQVAVAGAGKGQVYVSLVHEWEVKRAQNVFTNTRDRDPATYAQALDVFSERARAIAPHVKVVYWSGGYSGNQAIIGQVMALMTHAPDVVAWDPYVTKNNSSTMTATKLFSSFASFLDGNATYAAWGRPTKALGEFGFSTSFTDDAAATFYGGVQEGLEANGISLALQFDRDSTSYAYKIDGGATPQAQASFAAEADAMRSHYGY